jgi:hypothetical protein
VLQRQIQNSNSWPQHERSLMSSGQMSDVLGDRCVDKRKQLFRCRFTPCEQRVLDNRNKHRSICARLRHLTACQQQLSWHASWVLRRAEAEYCLSFSGQKSQINCRNVGIPHGTQNLAGECAVHPVLIEAHAPFEAAPGAREDETLKARQRAVMRPAR